jgi:hypothetical protein
MSRTDWRYITKETFGVCKFLACFVLFMYGLFRFIDWTQFTMRPYVYFLQEKRPPLGFPSEIACLRHLNAMLIVEKTDWLVKQRCVRYPEKWEQWEPFKDNTWIERNMP